MKKLKGKKAWVGIKPLIRMISTAEEAADDMRTSTFLTLLEEEAKLVHFTDALNEMTFLSKFVVVLILITNKHAPIKQLSRH